MKNGTADLVLPVVHLNGTSRDALIEQRTDACSAIMDALRALDAMAPNGRDYYPVPGSLRAAQEQHEHRIAALKAVYAGIEAEAEALADGR